MLPFFSLLIHYHLPKSRKRDDARGRLPDAEKARSHRHRAPKFRCGVCMYMSPALRTLALC